MFLILQKSNVFNDLVTKYQISITILHILLYYIKYSIFVIGHTVSLPKLVLIFDI
jgi:hypothetical protein